MSRLTTRIVRAAAAAAAALLAGPAGCGTAAQGGEQVTIMVPWSGAEFTAFYRLIETFESATRIHVNVEVTRAQTEQLDAAVQADAPPDLAVLPSVGAVDQYVDRGELRPITGIDPEHFLQPFRGLMTTAGGTVYAVPVKADVKSLIWYDPRYTAAPPTDPRALGRLAAGKTGFWCLGLESGPTSGWPGADWIADLYLAGNGVDAYESWLTGVPEWSTSPSIRAAWDTWAALVRESTASSATTPFGAAAAGMTKPAGRNCRMAHGALAAMGFPTTLAPGRDYDFAAPDAPTPLEVSADFLGMFTRGNPAALELIQYLAGAPVQTEWVRQPGGYALSANDQVPAGAYPGPVEKRIAALLQPDSGHPLCFSAADMMKPDLSTAFYQAVVDYVEAPSTLDSLLAGLQTTQSLTQTRQIRASAICSTPS